MKKMRHMKRNALVALVLSVTMLLTLTVSYTHLTLPTNSLV